MRRFDDLFKRLRLGDFDGDGDGDGGSSASDSRVHALRLRGSVITRNDKGKTSRDFKKLFQRQLAVLHYCQPVSFFVPLIDVVELFFPVLQKNPEMRCSSSKKGFNR
ncbi:hypothetical protein HZH66_009632 [Vespula vulgaris]|uniref:Uncharacterized protein n=1 Tax=Vespula vulgaris TaxID=7454 RepID=A0A834JPX5_VESVU|nr:hypothetical protein HZH66_009632 [Vespula vulgaris]